MKVKMSSTFDLRPSTLDSRLSTNESYLFFATVEVGIDDGFHNLRIVTVVVVEVEEDHAEVGVALQFNKLAEAFVHGLSDVLGLASPSIAVGIMAAGRPPDFGDASPCLHCAC